MSRSRVKRALTIGATVFACGCAGMGKSCSQFGASAFGSDWIIVQYAFDGRPFHCWRLTDAPVDSESGGNLNWKDKSNGHLVHVTGWENRVQVINGDFETAARLLGIEANQCHNGVYPANAATGQPGAP